MFSSSFQIRTTSSLLLEVSRRTMYVYPSSSWNKSIIISSPEDSAKRCKTFCKSTCKAWRDMCGSELRAEDVCTLPRLMSVFINDWRHIYFLIFSSNYCLINRKSSPVRVFIPHSRRWNQREGTRKCLQHEKLMAMKKLMIFDVPLNLVREKGNDNLAKILVGTINFYSSACVFMIRNGLTQAAPA